MPAQKGVGITLEQIKEITGHTFKQPKPARDEPYSFPTRSKRVFGFGLLAGQTIRKTSAFGSFRKMTT